MCRISLVWQDRVGSYRTQPGLLEDRSRSGVGISVYESIPVGTKVKIRGRRRELVGMVRYCRGGGVKYLIGILLDEADKTWNSFGAAF
jgi:hypothetical protein